MTFLRRNWPIAECTHPGYAGMITDNKGIMRLLLMPSAKLAPIELQAHFGWVPSAMIPVGGHPALWHVNQMYRDLGYHTVVAVHDNATVVEKYVQQYLPEVRVIDVGVTHSLGETIAVALDHVENDVEHLVINYADTYSSRMMKKLSG
jgi:NDP-sugar pyrophosphorylase family protein